MLHQVSNEVIGAPVKILTWLLLDESFNPIVHGCYCCGSAVCQDDFL